MCLRIHVSAGLSVCGSICLPVYLSARLPVCPSALLRFYDFETDTGCQAQYSHLVLTEVAMDVECGPGPLVE